MKSKIIKRIAAALSAMTMAVTMMMTSASAATTNTNSWSVQRIKATGASWSDQISQRIMTFRPIDNKSITKFESSCTSFLSSEYTNGDIAYVTLVVNKHNATGATTGNSTLTTQYHKQETKSNGAYYYRTITTANIAYGYELVATYTLTNPHDLSAIISGSARVTDGKLYSYSITH